MLFRVVCWLSLLSVCANSTFASGVDTFNKKLNALLLKHELPGVVVHIKQKDEVLLHQAYGYRNLDGNQPIFLVYAPSIN